MEVIKMDSKTKMINYLRASIDCNEELLSIIKSVCQRIGEELTEDYDYVEQVEMLPANDYLLLQSVIYIFNVADYDINFNNSLSLEDLRNIDDNQLGLFKECVDELCDRTDEIISWLNQVKKERYKKQYHLYLKENGYYD